MSIAFILASVLIGYFLKDILKIAIVIGLVIFIAVYKVEAFKMIYEGVLLLLGYLKGVIG